MKMKSRISSSALSAQTVSFSTAKNSPAPSPACEVRPCGMLVQKRNSSSSDEHITRIPTIRVKVKHGTASHEIYISSQASFGELKKALSARTGIHHLDQKLIYKDKERDSAAFLDTAGVKDKSKIVLVEDPVAQAKRLLEQHRMEKSEKASKFISAISLEVDKLASKVSAMEAIVDKGGRAVETDVVNLIEMLMNELLKLDGVVADGDVKLHRRMQVKRVQKYIETLDVIKVKNSVNAQPKTNGQVNHSDKTQHPKLKPQQEQKKYNQQQQSQQYMHTKMQYQQHKQKQAETHFQQPQQQAAGQTAEWDIFDSLFKSSTSIQIPTTVRPAMAVTSNPTTRFDWELF